MATFIPLIGAFQIAYSLDSLCETLTHSFLHSQVGFVAVRKAITSAIEKLKNDGLLVDNDEGVLSSSQLGVATFAANLSPLEAQRLSVDLAATLNKGLVFSSHFHLLFTIVPYNAVCNVDWNLFHTLYIALPDGEKNLLSSYGIPESVILQYIIMRRTLEAGEPGMRLYIGLLLQEVWKQQPHNIIADRLVFFRLLNERCLASIVVGYKTRYTMLFHKLLQLRSLLRCWVVSSHSDLAAPISEFYRSKKIPSLWPLRLLLPELVQRLSDCLVVELIPLMAIEGVKRGRARQLCMAGYKNVAKAILRDQLDEKIEELDAMGIEFSEIEERVKS
uniref:SHQ1 domain-containing protein n=1 Tax=Angiostrongylus cantonensis TaxID=6313 RepID=A0A0K0DIM0_ANGCA